MEEVGCTVPEAKGQRGWLQDLGGRRKRRQETEADGKAEGGDPGGGGQAGWQVGCTCCVVHVLTQVRQQLQGSSRSCWSAASSASPAEEGVGWTAPGGSSSSAPPPPAGSEGGRHGLLQFTGACKVSAVRKKQTLSIIHSGVTVITSNSLGIPEVHWLRVGASSARGTGFDAWSGKFSCQEAQAPENNIVTANIEG